MPDGGSARLIATRSGLPDGEYAVGSHPVVIGSERACDIVLRGTGVSPVHAEIDYVGGQLTVAKLSEDALLVNGEPIAVSRALVAGDKIQIGEEIFTFTPGAPDATHQAPEPEAKETARSASAPPSPTGGAVTPPPGAVDEDQRPPAPSGPTGVATPEANEEMATTQASGSTSEPSYPDAPDSPAGIDRHRTLVETPRALSTLGAGLPVGPAPSVWRSVLAFFVDAAFGYIPAYMGVLVASRGGFYNACGDAPCFGPGGDHFVLYMLPVILFFGRAPIHIYTRLRRRRDAAGSRRNDDVTPGDQLWATVLSWLGMVLSVAGKSYIPLAGFATARAGASFASAENPLSYGIIPLFEWIVPVLAGFLAIWEEDGQTLGQTVAGLQVQTLSGRPAGFIRMGLRTAVFQVLWFLAMWIFFVVTLPVGLYRTFRSAGGKGEGLARGTEYRPWYDVLAGTRLRMRGFALASDRGGAASGFDSRSFLFLVPTVVGPTAVMILFPLLDQMNYLFGSEATAIGLALIGPVYVWACIPIALWQLRSEPAVASVNASAVATSYSADEPPRRDGTQH